MRQVGTTEDTARRRLRSLRQARGWTIDQLASRANTSASTISRIENGLRRLSIDHLVALAAALGTTIEDLLVDDDSEDGPVIRPAKDKVAGVTVWLLTERDDPSGRVIAKMRLPGSKARRPETQVHPGRDWFYVLQGTVRLVLGGREHLVEAGSAAEFDTMTPHVLLGYGGAAEILTILDHHGERAHLHPPERPPR